MSKSEAHLESVCLHHCLKLLKEVERKKWAISVIVISSSTPHLDESNTCNYKMVGFDNQKEPQGDQFPSFHSSETGGLGGKSGSFRNYQSEAGPSYSELRIVSAVRLLGWMNDWLHHPVCTTKGDWKRDWSLNDLVNIIGETTFAQFNWRFPRSTECLCG